MKKYTLGRIIFALRNEYLRIQKELLELQKYIEVGSGVDKCSFQFSENSKKMFLAVQFKENVISELEHKFHGFLRGVDEVDFTSKLKEKYFCDKFEICSVNNASELEKSIDVLMNSDFNKNITINDVVPSLYDWSNIYLSHNGIEVFDYNLFNMKLTYDSKKDLIRIKSNNGVIVSSDVESLLFNEFKANDFNQYHRNIIDKYHDKHICIMEKYYPKVSDFQIVDKGRTMVLRRK